MGELVSFLKSEEYLRKSQLKMKRIREADLIIIDDLMYIAKAKSVQNYLTVTKG
jgi:DNA replication protein DnaC